MKKLKIVLVAFTVICIGTALAQTQETKKLKTPNQTETACARLSIADNCLGTHRNSVRPPRPPLPPAPPTPPGAPIPPDAPPAPDLQDLESIEEPAEPPPPPPPPPLPPPPPAPPEFKVPAQAQAACHGKEVGEKVKWNPATNEQYVGVCVRRADGLFFEVHEHRINRTSRK